MSDLFQSLVGLLGSPIDCPAFQTFLADYFEPPVIQETEWFHSYHFLKSGFNIMTDKAQNQIKMLFIELETVAVRSGDVARFLEPLPFSVLPDDDRETVKKKVGIECISEKVQGRTPRDPQDFYDNYKFPLLEYTFVFDGRSGRLCLISVHWTIDTVPRKLRPNHAEGFLENESSHSMLEALEFAKEEARSMWQPGVGSEFLLLGLMGNSSNIAARALASMGISIENVRREVRKITGTGRQRVKDPMYTPAAQVVLEEALNISKRLESVQIKEEHCLLSIMDSEGVGIGILKNLGVDFQRLEDEIYRLTKEGE